MDSESIQGRWKHGIAILLLLAGGVFFYQSIVKRPPSAVYAPEFQREFGRGVDNSEHNQKPRRGPTDRQRVR